MASILSIMLRCPLIIAQCRGVRPSLSCKEVRSGSNLRSSLVTSRWPLLQARCNGVHPSKSFSLAKSGRAFRISFTISVKYDLFRYCCLESTDPNVFIF